MQFTIQSGNGNIPRSVEVSKKAYDVFHDWCSYETRCKKAEKANCVVRRSRERATLPRSTCIARTQKGEAEDGTKSGDEEKNGQTLDARR
jgi:hypothetical protein